MGDLATFSCAAIKVHEACPDSEVLICGLLSAASAGRRDFQCSIQSMNPPARTGRRVHARQNLMIPFFHSHL